MPLSAPSPFSFILFGASGHLAQLKLYPALFTLAYKRRLPERYNIVGFARSKMDDDSFRKLVAQSIREHVPEANDGVLKEFLTHVYYRQGQYTAATAFKALHRQLQTLESGWKKKCRLVYFSVPPNVFSTISQNLRKSRIYTGDIPFCCIVEKPVGSDFKSFERVKAQLLKCFAAEEIYLLDHYLGKEAVRNLYYLRYANPVLERLLKHTLIHHVEITVAESVGIEQRAGYFEHTGTFRDMFQSHLMMIMALLTMHLHEDTNTLRERRLNALKQLYLPPTTSMDDVVVQGQYTQGTVDGKEVPGYREENGVAPKSRTNTFAALRLLTRMSRWAGVPFYLRSGKRLEKKDTRISIRFQELHPVGKGSAPNQLHIILFGEAGMRLELQTKLGGPEPAFRPLVLSDPLVCVGDCLPEHSFLLLEAIHSRQQWFLSFEEVQTAWRLLDPVQTHLGKKRTPLYTYAAGSRSPEETDAWLAKDGTSWMYL